MAKTRTAKPAAPKKAAPKPAAPKKPAAPRKPADPKKPVAVELPPAPAPSPDPATVERIRTKLRQFCDNPELEALVEEVDGDIVFGCVGHDGDDASFTAVSSFMRGERAGNSLLLVATAVVNDLLQPAVWSPPAEPAVA
jgi:hypothetical protein